MLQKRTQGGLVVASFAVVLGVASTGHAATWAEVGDAGDLPAIAQSPLGLGTLTAITGSIAGSVDADMYRICLLGGKTFSASTLNDVDVPTFDTQLFLFNSAGFGVYTSDDVPPGYRSRLSAGHPLTPTASGVYYLAITSYNRDPVSAGGEIFPETFPGIFGPTGPGGGLPIIGWTGMGGSGIYRIDLTGTELCDDIDIDIRPGSSTNPINLKSKGVIPVAILTTSDFDATTVDPDTVCFGDTENDAQRDCTESHGQGHYEDVDGDGDLDLVLHFNTRETGIDAGDTSACLSGETFGGDEFAGCDLITIVPP